MIHGDYYPQYYILLQNCIQLLENMVEGSPTDLEGYLGFGFRDSIIALLSSSMS